MANISRKELKEEVREPFAPLMEAIQLHQKEFIAGAVVVLIVAAVVFAWVTYSQQQTAKASAAYGDAMAIYSAPVGAPQQPNQLTYADDSAKFTAAAQHLGDVASKYPRTRPGKLALYFQALSLEKISKNDAATKILQHLSDSGDDELVAMARFQMAQLDDQTGHGDEAVKLYQQLMDKPTVFVTKPIVMLALAEHYSQNDPSRAAKLYTQIKTDYPQTAIAQQADQELSLLPAKS